MCTQQHDNPQDAETFNHERQKSELVNLLAEIGQDIAEYAQYSPKVAEALQKINTKIQTQGRKPIVYSPAKP